MGQSSRQKIMKEKSKVHEEDTRVTVEPIEKRKIEEDEGWAETYGLYEFITFYENIAISRAPGSRVNSFVELSLQLLKMNYAPGSSVQFSGRRVLKNYRDTGFEQLLGNMARFTLATEKILPRVIRLKIKFTIYR